MFAMAWTPWNHGNAKSGLWIIVLRRPHLIGDPNSWFCVPMRFCAITQQWMSGLGTVGDEYFDNVVGWSRMPQPDAPVDVFEIKAVAGSGDVFADLGLATPSKEELQSKLRQPPLPVVQPTPRPSPSPNTPGCYTCPPEAYQPTARKLTRSDLKVVR